MENLPAYISLIFIITTIITVLLLYKATHYLKPAVIVILLWLALQAIIALSGFYKVTTTLPPRLTLLLIPPMLFIVYLFNTKKGVKTIKGLDSGTLTLLHVVRIPVELTLYALYLHKVIPEVMTFEGRNFDILCGISAPFIYYFGYIKKVLNRKILLAWNIACILLLANIVITAILSAPFPFQQLAFEQPNIAVLYFPFIWLPGCIVPMVIFAHAVCIKQLANK
jgi:hypothetical protein